jgi:hypothetical protein
MGEQKEEVTIVFGADGTKLESGLEGMKRKTLRAGDDIAKSFKSERVVSRQMKGFIEDLGSARSATDVLASAGEHLGESMKASSLLMGVGIAAAIGLGVKAMETYTEEILKAREAAYELGRVQIGGSASSLESAIQKYADISEQLHHALTESSYGSRAFDEAGAILHSFVTPWRDTPSGRDRQEDEQRKAERKIGGPTKALTAEMGKQLEVSKALAIGDQLSAKLLAAKLAGEEKIADMRAQEKTILSDIHDPAVKAKEADHLKKQLALQQQINDEEYKAAEREVGIERAALAQKITAATAVADAAAAQLAGQKAIAAYIKQGADYSGQIAEWSKTIYTTDQERQAALDAINKSNVENIALIKLQNDDEQASYQQAATSETASAKAAQDTLAFKIKEAAYVKIGAEWAAKDLATSQKHFASQKVRNEEYAANASEAQSAYETADRADRSRLINLGSQITQGQSQIDILNQINEGNELGSERTKIWADYQKQVDENAANTTISLQQQAAILQNLTTLASAQDDAWKKQYAITRAQLDAETRIAHLRETEGRKRIDAIKAEEDAERTAIANTAGDEQQRHINKMADLANERAQAELDQRNKTGAQLADELRAEHALESQKRIDRQKDAGSGWNNNLTGSDDWQKLFHGGPKPVPKVPAPIAKPPPPPVTPTDGIAAAVGKAINDTLKDRLLVVTVKT